MTAKRYCYLDPPFPKNMYVTLAFFREEGLGLLYPLLETFASLKALTKGLRKLKRGIKKKRDADIYGALVVYLEYDHSFPMKREYWDTPTTATLNPDTRTNAYMEMLKGAHPFYWVLITPQGYIAKTKSWVFTNWLPILISSTDKQIRALLKASNQAIEIKSKSIGMYKVMHVQGFDIEEGELIEPKQEDKPTEANC